MICELPSEADERAPLLRATGAVSLVDLTNLLRDESARKLGKALVYEPYLLVDRLVDLDARSWRYACHASH